MLFIFPSIAESGFNLNTTLSPVTKPSEGQSATAPKPPPDAPFRPADPPFFVIEGDGRGLFKLEDVDTPPKPVGKWAEPVYPFELKRKGVTGEAVIVFMVTTDGKTKQIQVERASHHGFADAAMVAVKQWRFRPAIKDGKPVNCLMLMPIAFNLEQ